MINTTVAVKTEPQCQHFVTRKKRLCRMTVRPGRQYCGEHDPQPLTDDGKTDKRVPCPNDPKHTCYVSKLEKHLTICNARQGELPPYMIMNINAPVTVDTCIRKPLSEISKQTLMLLIDKVNFLYDKHVINNITTAPERPIHSVVLPEFNEPDRTESSLRHLRQASRLLWLAEDEGLVQENTCYVELGAGKGQMSYYAGQAWCGGSSRVLAVDRAALRHKRDTRLAARCSRMRADLRHVALAHAPAAAGRALLGLAKHLCGVATDYALRCLTAPGGAGGAGGACRGAVLATCCHHRCERGAYVANAQLQELGISGDEMNVMLGMVSWATCGDGRPRHSRKRDPTVELTSIETDALKITESGEASPRDDPNHDQDYGEGAPSDARPTGNEGAVEDVDSECAAARTRAGRRTKALLDWGRVLYLRDRGFDARLCYYVPTSVSLENVCIVAKKAVQM